MMKRKRLLLSVAVIVLLLVSLITFVPQANNVTSTNTAAYRLEKIFETNGVVWSFAFISSQELLVTRRDGKLFYVNLAQNTQKQLLIPPVIAAGQGGVLDVHFRAIGGKGYIYLTYSTQIGDQLTTALARGIWDGQMMEKPEALFVAKIVGDSGRHFGSRLLFDGDYIYMTIGDRGERDYAQNLSYHNGKILRLDTQGRAAQNNPFVSVSAALPEIWSYGHRNPQGIDYERRTGEIYSVEFGPRGGDELNLIKPGKNYGWPVITYGREYWGPKIGDTHHPDMEQPVAHWVPSISPSGMAFYDGDKIPEWQGNLFLANLSAAHLRRLALDENGVVAEEILFSDLGERIRHVRSGPDGYLYFSTDSGKIIRVSLP